MAIDQILGIRLIVLLGFNNLVGLALVLASCRCIPGLHSIFPGLLQNKTYLKFYNYHCYFWVYFILSVAAHVATVLLTYGVPI